MINGALRSSRALPLAASPARPKLASEAPRKINSATLLWVVMVLLIGLNACMIAWSPLILERIKLDGADEAADLHPPARHLAQAMPSKNAVSVAGDDAHLPPPFRDDAPPALPSYSREMAYLATRPVPWTCGDKEEVLVDPLTGEKPIFAFVHVYKAAGSTLRSFFKKYSAYCKRSWMVLIGCTGVEPSSIVSNQTSWKGCRVKEVLDRDRTQDHEGKKKRVYPTVNATILKSNVDIVGGHFRLGTGDSIFGNVGDRPATSPVRHIVFLRDPMARLVSGVLYQHQTNDEHHSLEDTVNIIKKRIRGSWKNREYSGISLKYLLTPHQAEKFAHIHMDAEQNPTPTPETSSLSPEERLAEAKARAAIQNLRDYNVIVGMSESMDHSMRILRQVLVYEFTSERREEWVKELFDEYIRDEAKKDVRKNVSGRGNVSTDSVLEELKKDGPFMKVFVEYVKYEQLITDFAWKMHSMQYEMTGSTTKTK